MSYAVLSPLNGFNKIFIHIKSTFSITAKMGAVKHLSNISQPHFWKIKEKIKRRCGGRNLAFGRLQQTQLQIMNKSIRNLLYSTNHAGIPAISEQIAFGIFHKKKD
ncbi:MAG: hypothetical protein J6J90_03685 [Angelakisella sp.]|nr:hypothetical protein [Angelakisella sp.]